MIFLDKPPVYGKIANYQHTAYLESHTNHIFIPYPPFWLFLHITFSYFSYLFTVSSHNVSLMRTEIWACSIHYCIPTPITCVAHSWMNQQMVVYQSSLCWWHPNYVSKHVLLLLSCITPILSLQHPKLHMFKPFLSSSSSQACPCYSGMWTATTREARNPECWVYNLFCHYFFVIC